MSLVVEPGSDPALALPGGSQMDTEQVMPSLCPIRFPALRSKGKSRDSGQRHLFLGPHSIWSSRSQVVGQACEWTGWLRNSLLPAGATACSRRVTMDLGVQNPKSATSPLCDWTNLFSSLVSLFTPGKLGIL